MWIRDAEGGILNADEIERIAIHESDDEHGEKTYVLVANTKIQDIELTVRTNVHAEAKEQLSIMLAILNQ